MKRPAKLYEVLLSSIGVVIVVATMIYNWGTSDATVRGQVNSIQNQVDQLKAALNEQSNTVKEGFQKINDNEKQQSETLGELKADVRILISSGHFTENRSK